MTRIIAGRAGGRRLVVPAGVNTRPTSARAREGLFSTLVSLHGELSGRRILDLYAGSGALGLEALSRGAAEAVMVESAPKAVSALRANVAAAALPGAVVVADRVERWLARQSVYADRDAEPGRPYDVVLADPPYQCSADALATLLAGLAAAGLVAPGASTVAVERYSRDPVFGWPAGWTALRTRRYGEATLWYGRPA